MSVDFPAPLRPMTPTISPLLTSNDTPLIAAVAPKHEAQHRFAGRRLARG